MTDILNLDALQDEKQFILDGRARPLRMMTVDQYIHSKSFDEAFEAADFPGRVKLLIELIEPQVAPETTREELGRMNLKQLMAMLAYVRGEESPNPAAESAEGNESPTPSSDKSTSPSSTAE